MELFLHYRPSERRSGEPLRRTVNFGRLLTLLVIALLFSHRLEARPGLWSALGVTAGFYIMLRAAASLGVPVPPATARGRRLAETRDAWFPLFLFSVQSVFMLVSIAVFWTTFCEIGFPARFWHHTLALALALSIPAYRLARQRLLIENTPRHDLAERFFRYLLISLVCILLAGMTMPLLDVSRELRADDQLVFLVIVWSAALLVAAVCALTFVDHWIKLLRPTAKPSQADRPTGRIDNPRDAWGP